MTCISEFLSQTESERKNDKIDEWDFTSFDQTATLALCHLFTLTFSFALTKLIVLFFPSSRCRHSDNLRHTTVLVRSPALRYPSRRVSLRSYRSSLAYLHEHARLVQHLSLELSGLPGT
jgi:hypothetical protein